MFTFQKWDATLKGSEDYSIWSAGLVTKIK